MNLTMGVDPGADTGIAVWDEDRKQLLALVTIKSPLAAEMAVTMANIHCPKEILIEKPRGAIYPRRGQGTLQMLKIARNVGQCQALADEIVRALEKAGWHDARTIPPAKGGTKWPAALFKRTFGYKGKSSSHSRDAAVIARYGH